MDNLTIHEVHPRYIEACCKKQYSDVAIAICWICGQDLKVVEENVLHLTDDRIIGTKANCPIHGDSFSWRWKKSVLDKYK